MDFCVGIWWDMLGYAGIMSERFWGRNMQQGMNMKTSEIWLIFLSYYFRGQSGTCEVCLLFVWLSILSVGFHPFKKIKNRDGQWWPRIFWVEIDEVLDSQMADFGGWWWQNMKTREGWFRWRSRAGDPIFGVRWCKILGNLSKWDRIDFRRTEIDWSCVWLVEGISFWRVEVQTRVEHPK